MSKFETVTVYTVGYSKTVVIPAKLVNDKEYPFSEDETDFVMEIGKDSKGRKGLFIRRI